MQTIPLAVIANRWVEAIKDNDRINEFCQAKYGKDLSIFVGYDDAGAPLEEDCPCVIVLMDSKSEGLADSYSYTLQLVWGVHRKEAERNGRVITYTGAFETDELGQLLIECIMAVNPNYPVINIDYETDNISWRPVYPGKATLTIEIPHVIGGNVEY